MHARPHPRSAIAAPWRAGLLALLALAAAAPAAHAASRTFHAEGADTGAGLGPRYVAQGGAGVAGVDDVHAAVLNPAGLVGVGGFEVALSRQAGAPLQPLNFVGLAWRLPIDEARRGFAASVALAHYPRVHARATGAYEAGDFESLFLRYLLPGINGTFDGTIESKTKSTRLAVGFGPGAGPQAGAAWSAGLYVERIDCRSTFCGVHATSNGFTTSSTGAVATGVGFGLRWRVAPAWVLGASVADLRTRLAIDSETTDAAGTRRSVQQARFPRKWALGLAWTPAPGWRVAADAEQMRGAYGRSFVDLQVLRVGAEWRRAAASAEGAWAWRAGAVVPVKVASSESGRLRAPFPFAPTLGLGWRAGAFSVDVALYAHAVMSMHEDRPVPAAELGLGWRF